MRIEVLGPSGVGKSSILRACEKNWKYAWPTAKEVAVLGTAKLEKHTPRLTFKEAMDQMVSADFYQACFDTVFHSRMRPSQKFSAMQTLYKTCKAYVCTEMIGGEVGPLLQEELFLHRAFSILPYAEEMEREARTYFEKAPVPDAAVIFYAPNEVLRARIQGRAELPNVYIGLSEPELETVIRNTLRICDIAAEVLPQRGVQTVRIDTSLPVEEAAAALLDFVLKVSPREATPAGEEEELKHRLLEASESFQKKGGRHFLKTEDVIYCSFTTPNFTVTKEEAQRDSARRFERLGLHVESLRGKTVLDLGCHTGAMLFQASNFGIESGLGVEYDAEKAEISREIAKLSNLSQLQFRQGDVDALSAEALGTFDVVFCFAIEAHVQNPAHLYELLGAVTKETLYFEGNSGCNIPETREVLEKAGFRTIEELGFCDDDVRASNNTRPMLRATK